MNIPLITLKGQQPGPRLLILGGVHGDEYEPIACLRRLVKVLDREDLSGQVTLVPVVNQPAFSSVSRTGPDGLDLARTFPGKVDGSATEQIAYQISGLIRQADALIDLHTGGLTMQISPLTGYMLHNDSEVLDRQRQMATAFNLPIVWGTSSKLNGRTLSVARDANLPAIYAEWGGGGGCDPRGVEDYVQGCFNVMHLLKMIDRPPNESRIRYIVEDDRAESGHLQKNYPAEASGYFEAVCQLHDRVNSGDLLGWIHQLNLEESVPVVSVHCGVVVLLRAIPSVQSGDCLAVVLETDGTREVRHE